MEREPLPDRVQCPWSSDNSFEQWTTRKDLKEQKPTNQCFMTNFSTHNNQTPWNSYQPDVPDDGSKVVTEAAIQTIDSYEKDTVIYTDGSCKDGTEDGGAAAVVTTGSARYPIELEVLQKKGSRYTCSYDEEKAAIGSVSL